jgi:hypothetical protein
MVALPKDGTLADFEDLVSMAVSSRQVPCTRPAVISPLGSEPVEKDNLFALGTGSVRDQYLPTALS